MAEKFNRKKIPYLFLLALALSAFADTGVPNKAKTPSSAENERLPRNFQTFLPKKGETIEDPATQVVQILLDRQDQGAFTSYMVQVLFHGRPAARNFRVLENRIVIDFFDTGKPSNRLAKIRGGALEASLLEELFYQDPTPSAPKSSSQKPSRHLKSMVKLTLFINGKVLDLKFRDTLDRTLIHFRLPKSLDP